MNFSKAIPTMYKGQKFKSRLEADTAFLFDTIHYKWEYEPISYLLSDGTHYLPDFYISKLKLFVECRGYITEKGERQVEQFGKMVLNHEVNINNDHSCDFLVIKYPNCLFYDSSDKSSDRFFMAQCRSCGSWGFYGSSGSYTCKVCGEYDGDHHLKNINTIILDRELLINGVTAREWANVHE